MIEWLIVCGVSVVVGLLVGKVIRWALCPWRVSEKEHQHWDHEFRRNGR